jgi:glucosylceramidase
MPENPLCIRAAFLAVFIPMTLPAATAPTAGRIWSLVETARDNGHLLAPLAAPAAAPAASASAADTIACDLQQRCQEMVGFGGALTESAAWVLAQLPADKRLEVIRRYYDPKDGIGYTLARTHINSCDFSLQMWALDETPGDYTLAFFTLEPMRRWVLPLIHDAQKIAGPDRFHLLASPWSPPAWMKTNNRMDDGGSLLAEYRPSWANYFVRFVQTMEIEEKIPVWALTVQNEPEAKQTWESCLYKPEEERDFVRDHLGPALAKAGLNDVHLLVCDHNRDILYKRASAVYLDAAAARYVWGAGLHWYVSQDFGQSSRLHDFFPGKAILFTEGCIESGTKPGQWDRGERYAHNMIGDFRNWVCGWIDWNIALDFEGGPNHVGNFCDAPVLVDLKSGKVEYQNSFYYIAQFSRFVKNGARRIVSGGGPQALESVAFVNPDGAVVAVVLNPTDATTGFTLTVGAERLACHIPAHAIQTYTGAPR